MPATRDGKMWRCQFYYEDWQGVRHKKNKRGFKTKAEAEAWERNFRQQQQKDLDISFENFVEIYFAALTRAVCPPSVPAFASNHSMIALSSACFGFKRKVTEFPIVPPIRCYQQDNDTQLHLLSHL